MCVEGHGEDCQAEIEGFLNEQNFFSPQTVFRKRRSTDVAFDHEWSPMIETLYWGWLALGVFLEVAAAFDHLSLDYFLQSSSGLAVPRAQSGGFASRIAVPPSELARWNLSGR